LLAEPKFSLNAVITSLDLKEIVLCGRQYTQAIRREIPTYEKLHRLLANIEWEQKFPLILVRALTRTRSNHTPLLIDLGEQAHLRIKVTSHSKCLGCT
jgi:hypothetical protein